MEQTGIILALIPLIMGCIFAILSPKITKITKNYFFWATLGLVLIS
jgi:hypothetical protein